MKNIKLGKEINKVYLVLLVIFLTGFFLRLYPATIFDTPLKYDAYYHARVAELIQETGSIPFWEPWPYGGRPHIYPPLYPISLAITSSVVGAPPLEVSRFLLPVVSSFLVLAVFWLVRQFRNDRLALLTSFLIAVNPYLIMGSYDSPQVIGILLACFAIYFLLKKRYYEPGLLIAVAFLFNTFSAALVSIPFLLFLLFNKEYRSIAKLFIIPAATVLLWYLLQAASLSCYNGYIGPYYIFLSATHWVSFYTPVLVGFVLITFSLIDNLKNKFRNFWFLWTCVFILIYLAHYVTPAFHPWRQDFFLMFGLSFLFIDLMYRVDKRKLFFFAVFIVLAMFALKGMFNPVSLGPSVAQHEFLLINHLDTYPNTVLPLANHNYCANILGTSNKTCLLDINFECIPDTERWTALEQVYWTSDVYELQTTLNTYEMTHIIYSSADWGRPILEKFDVDKIYASWACSPYGCNRDATIYAINRDNNLQVRYFGE